jgi:hypothetical protein
MEAPECKTLLRETKVSSLLAMKAAAGKPLIWLGSRATVGELVSVSQLLCGATTIPKFACFVARQRHLPVPAPAVTVDVQLDTLSSHGILSAPIFVSDETPSPECLLGFLDVWTVLSAFLTSLPPGALHVCMQHMITIW